LRNSQKNMQRKAGSQQQDVRYNLSMNGRIELAKRSQVGLQRMLPPHLCKVVSSAGRSHNVPDNMIACSLLPVIATAAGPGACVAPDPESSLVVMVSFYSLLVAEPGTGKTPASEVATEALQLVQAMINSCQVDVEAGKRCSFLGVSVSVVWSGAGTACLGGARCAKGTRTGPADN
jgi:hypothetical protein